LQTATATGGRPRAPFSRSWPPSVRRTGTQWRPPWSRRQYGSSATAADDRAPGQRAARSAATTRD